MASACPSDNYRFLAESMQRGFGSRDANFGPVAGGYWFQDAEASLVAIGAATVA
jgi:hypothetical protein